MLTATLEGALRRHAAESYPSEACGLIVQAADGVIRAVRCENAAPTRDRFEIPAADLVALRREDHTLLAFYHSHPDGPATLSARDQRAAVALGRPTWPGVDHLVVSVPGGIPERIGRFAWDAGAGRFLALAEDP